MVSVLTSNAVDCGFHFRSGQTKDYKIGICCFSSKQAALKSKSKDWLSQNKDNVSELFQWTNTIKINLSMLGIPEEGYSRNVH